MAEMNTFTLELDERLMEAIRQYAEKNRTTVTNLITAYLRTLTQQEPSAIDLPMLCQLSGILPSDISEEAYQEHLVEKYGL